MPTINLLSTGLVYRNPEPHLAARHTWHPTVLPLPSGRILCSFDIGQGSESHDYRTYLSHSDDQGKSWSHPRRFIRFADRPDGYHTVRLSRSSSSEVLAMGFLPQRRDLGLVNRDNLGFVPTDIILARSQDDGLTWSHPSIIQPPLVGPGFEVCHPIVELADGRWLWPTSTWRGWDGEEGSGMRAIAFVSTDKGQSWPSFIEVIDQRKDRTFTWEQSLIQLADGRLISLGWSFHEPSGTTLPNVYAISHNAKTFGPHQTAPIHAETAKLLALPAGRIFCLYRGLKQPGLWGAIMELKADKLTLITQSPLWQGSASTVSAPGQNSTNSLSWLKFGYPSLSLLPSAELFAAFWCMEDNIQNIRWLKLSLT